MKRWTAGCAVILFFACITRAHAQEPAYIIGPSDLLEISVWGEQNLSRQVTVRNDGFISLPLVGDMAVAGKTTAQVKDDLEKGLARYIKDPRCAVIVVEQRSKRFYVQGQVARPGQYTLDQTLTLTQVISVAGGFTQWADENDIVILRGEGDARQRIIVDFTRIAKGKAQDIPIMPGDTIIVP
ncbi:MAG TPA: polysaccharide biosynthesis/export family protein [Deltaproteobacteria bacterium]|nr:polysaccharide biosynthesis/export family protein [Deltaproteobacteria bacterium]